MDITNWPMIQWLWFLFFIFFDSFSVSINWFLMLFYARVSSYCSPFLSSLSFLASFLLHFPSFHFLVLSFLLFYFITFLLVRLFFSLCLIPILLAKVLSSPCLRITCLLWDDSETHKIKWEIKWSLNWWEQCRKVMSEREKKIKGTNNREK